MKHFVALFVVLALGACGHEHPQPEEAEGLESLVYTHFTNASELFVEFEPLRVGEASTFAAHLTRLSDFKPVTEGRVEVLLSEGGHPEERFQVAAPASPGIFKPVVTPKHTGERRLVLSLEAPGLRVTHDLGPVPVHASSEAAAQAPKQDERDAGIRFLKEQQWQVEFATAPAALHLLRTTVAATAVIRVSPGRSAQLVAPVSGQVSSVGASFPRMGASAARGDVLFTLIPKLAADADVATLHLDADRAQLKLALAQKERARLETLYEQEAVAERRVAAARNEEAMARVEVQAAQKRLAPYAGGSSGASGVAVRAPLAGRIVEIGVTPGAYVSEGQPLARLADTASLWLEAKVAEADLARLGEPRGAWLRAPGLAEPIAIEVGRNATLVALGAVLDPATRTAPVIFEFRNPNQGLAIGAALRAEIWSGAAAEKVAIPASAVVEEGGMSVVYVQRGGESFERRVVALGIRDGRLLEVREGLQPGERIVTRGAYLVRLAGASPKSAGEGHVH